MRRALLAVLLLGLIGGAVWSLRTGERPRILVIGLDGLDWKVVDRLAAEGRLPHLSGLKAEGAHGPILTLTDIPLSPVIWTSIATGKGPAKHNITWFLVDTPEGGRVPVRSYNRNAKALWNILAEDSRKSGVVGWWATAPAERVGDGIIVSDALGFHGFGSSGRGLDDNLKTYPPELYPEVARRMPPLQQIDYGFGQRFFNLSAREYYERSYSPGRAPSPNPANPIHLFQEYTATMEGYTGISRQLLTGEDFDVFMVYFEATDSISHLFMKYAPPRLPWVNEQEYEQYKDVVDRYYEYADTKVGELLSLVDESWLVVVVSDHGFRSGANRPRSVKTVDIRGAHLDHEPEGVFIARGPNIRKGRFEGASVLDVTPTLLRYLGMPVATDMDGRVLDEIFDEEWREARPIEYVATYERADGITHTAPPVTSSGGPGGGDGVSSDALERLRTLGYVGSSGGGETPPEKLSSPEQHNNLGRIHFRNGDPAGALREFRLALEIDPDNAQAHTNIGHVFLAQGRQSEALRSYTRALESNPNDPMVLQNLADLKLKSGQLRDAELLFRQALAIDDRLPHPYIGLGDTLQRLGRQPEAERVLKRAIELDPASLEAHYNLGVVYLRQENVEGARKEFLRALEINSGHSMTLNNLGHLASQEDNLEEARDYLEKAASADPRNLEPHFNLGALLLRMKHPDEAIPWLEKAIRINTQFEPSHFNLALALIQAERLGDAEERLTVLVRLFPQSVRGLVQLARLYHATGKRPQVENCLKRACQLGGAEVRSTIVSDPGFAELDPDSWLPRPPGQ